MAQRRRLVRLFELGIPVTPYDEQEGALAFDLVSDRSDGEP